MKAKQKRVPPNYNAHNAAQDMAAKVHADAKTSKGVLGRMMKVLDDGPENWHTGLYSSPGQHRIFRGPPSSLPPSPPSPPPHTFRRELPGRRDQRQEGQREAVHDAIQGAE